MSSLFYYTAVLRKGKIFVLIIMFVCLQSSTKSNILISGLNANNEIMTRPKQKDTKAYRFSWFIFSAQFYTCTRQTAVVTVVEAAEYNTQRPDQCQCNQWPLSGPGPALPAFTPHHLSISSTPTPLVTKINHQVLSGALVEIIQRKWLIKIDV